MNPQEVLNRIAWAFAPDWAVWLSQDEDGECGFWDCEPVEHSLPGRWTFPGEDEPQACYTHPGSLGYYGKQRRPWAKPCPCADRPASQCPGQFRAGCELCKVGNPSRPQPAEASGALRVAVQRAPKFSYGDGFVRVGTCGWGSTTSSYAQHAPEDPARAAYLARWANAPEWAEWLAQDVNASCFWLEIDPTSEECGGWSYLSGQWANADSNVLGSVRCERRPKP